MSPRRRAFQSRRIPSTIASSTPREEYRPAWGEISEISPTPGRYSARGVEEAIVDGIILLRSTRRLGDILRVLQVVKMRGTPHSRALYVLELTPIGILLAPHLKGGRTFEE